MAYAITHSLSTCAHGDSVSVSLQKPAALLDTIAIIALVTVTALNVLTHTGLSLKFMQNVGTGSQAWILGGCALAITVADVLAYCLGPKHAQAKAHSHSASAISVAQQQSKKLSKPSQSSTIHRNRQTSKKQVHEKQVHELFNFLFGELITKDNLMEIQPLGDLLPGINNFLNGLNTRYSLSLQAIKSQHSFTDNDPWQTIKLIDISVKKEGQQSPFLSSMNDMLHTNYGILSNGGDQGEIRKDKKKRTPTSFKNLSGEYMFPQLQLSLLDAQRIVGMLPTQEEYIKALHLAWGRI